MQENRQANQIFEAKWANGWFQVHGTLMEIVLPTMVQMNG